MADDIRHEHHNSEGHQETTIPEHHHRAIIGLDKNGIPKVLVPADSHTHTHVNINIKTDRSLFALITTILRSRQRPVFYLQGN